MAQESCNLDKDEAELLKPPPSASAAAPAPPPPAASAAPPAMFQQQQQQLGSRAVEALKLEPPINSPSSARKRKLEEAPSLAPPEAGGSPAACSGKAQKLVSTPDAPAAAARSTAVNRCSCCQKRVGLTGFRCRCGDLFCAQHRYSDAHGCSYDYKAAGRAEISKANPVVRAPKIIKI